MNSKDITIQAVTETLAAEHYEVHDIPWRDAAQVVAELVHHTLKLVFGMKHLYLVINTRPVTETIYTVIQADLAPSYVSHVMRGLKGPYEMIMKVYDHSSDPEDLIQLTLRNALQTVSMRATVPLWQTAEAILERLSALSGDSDDDTDILPPGDGPVWGISGRNHERFDPRDFPSEI